MTKRDWFWTVIWLLIIVGVLGVVGRDDYDMAEREAAYYESYPVGR